MSKGQMPLSTDKQTAMESWHHKAAQPEIIRCKDCKHHTYEEPGMVYCPTNIVGGWVSEDFFCKDGERRESDG